MIGEKSQACADQLADRKSRDNPTNYKNVGVERHFNQGQSLANIRLTPGSYDAIVPNSDSVTLNTNAIPEPTNAAFPPAGDLVVSMAATPAPMTCNAW